MGESLFLLDSNICIYALAGRSDSLKLRLTAQPAGSLAISSISLAEVGVRYGETVETDAGLRAFLRQVEVLPFDEAAARIYAKLLFRRGSFDRLIAAHAVSLGRILVTNNERDFADIPGLRLENWIRA